MGEFKVFKVVENVQNILDCNGRIKELNKKNKYHNTTD